MSDENKISLRVWAAKTILKKPREIKANLEQTWKSFLTDNLKLKREKIDGLIVCSRDFTRTNPRESEGWWATLDQTIEDSSPRFEKYSRIHSVKLVSREGLNLVKITAGNQRIKQEPPESTTGNPSGQIQGPSTSHALRNSHFQTARISTSETLPLQLFPQIEDNAVSDAGDLQQNDVAHDDDDDDDYVTDDDGEDDYDQFVEDLSQGTQPEDLQTREITDVNIKPVVTRITLGYTNDTMLEIKKEMQDLKNSDIIKWREINTSYLPKTFSFLKEAFEII